MNNLQPLMQQLTFSTYYVINAADCLRGRNYIPTSTSGYKTSSSLRLFSASLHVLHVVTDAMPIASDEPSSRRYTRHLWMARYCRWHWQLVLLFMVTTHWRSLSTVRPVCASANATFAGDTRWGSGQPMTKARVMRLRYTLNISLLSFTFPFQLCKHTHAKLVFSTPVTFPHSNHYFSSGKKFVICFTMAGTTTCSTRFPRMK